MAGESKLEFPPLLSVGFWPHTLSDINARCVTAFPLSITRRTIMDGLSDVVSGLNQCGMPMEIWVNGSFLTQKINPDDSDVAVRLQGEVFDSANPADRLRVSQYLARNFKQTKRCDLYAFPEYREGHPLYGRGQWNRAYWLNKFGYSRTEQPKGLAVIHVPFLVSP